MKRGLLITLIPTVGLALLATTGCTVTEHDPAPRLAEIDMVDPDAIVRMRDREWQNPMPNKPTAVTLVKVSLSGSGTSIDIKYNGIATYDLATPSNVDTIEELVDKVLLEEGFPVWGTPSFENADDLSQLSIKNKVPSYMVFVLECGNCNFMTEEWPFRVQRTRTNFLLSPRVAWRTSPTSTITKHEDTADRNANAKVGYFIAYPDRHITQQGGHTFRSAFNIYIELTYQNSKPVPITIDPDVGYPGGTEP